MYLQNQIQMLNDRLYELKEEVEKKEKEMLRLEFIIDQIEETKEELEECIVRLQQLEKENEDNLAIFDGKE